MHTCHALSSYFVQVQGIPFNTCIKILYICIIIYYVVYMYTCMTYISTLYFISLVLVAPRRLPRQQ